MTAGEDDKAHKGFAALLAYTVGLAETGAAWEQKQPAKGL
jgi:hypothetical protein